MSEAIRDRRPTEADADSLGFIECWWSSKGEWRRHHWNGATAQNSVLPWRPIDQTPPPEEKQKRWKGQVSTSSGRLTLALEVLPGDPPDLDEFLQRFDAWFKCCEPRVTIKEVIAARHGEGGDK